MELNQREHNKSSNNNNNSNHHDTEGIEMVDDQQELTGILKKSNHQARSQHRVLIIDHQESVRSGRGGGGGGGGGRSGIGTRRVGQRTNKHKGVSGNGSETSNRNEHQNNGSPPPKEKIHQVTIEFSPKIVGRRKSIKTVIHETCTTIWKKTVLKTIFYATKNIQPKPHQS